MAKIELAYVKSTDEKILIIRGDWDENLTEELQQKNYQFDHLSISRGKGPSLNFIVECYPNLESMTLNHTMIDASAIEQLSQLKYLHFLGLNNSKIDFTKLPRLEALKIETFNKTLASLFSSQSLKELRLTQYSGKDCSELASLTSLVKLELVQGSLTTLDGLEKLPHLESVLIAYIRNLSDIQALNEVPKLNNLEIFKCKKLTPIEIIQQLPIAIKHRKGNFNNENEDLAAIPKEHGGYFDPDDPEALAKLPALTSTNIDKPKKATRSRLKKRDLSVVLPQIALGEVCWKLTGGRFTDQDQFNASVVQYHRRLDRSSAWQPESIALPCPHFALQYACYNDNDEEEDRVVILVSDNGVSFSTGELLFKIHQAIVNDLADADRTFFEGLVLDSTTTRKNVPHYVLRQGS